MSVSSTIFIKYPSDLKVRAQTYSSYNTVKYLIVTTHLDVISFMSKGWVDNQVTIVTENCGAVQNLALGDLILADRDFDTISITLL